MFTKISTPEFRADPVAGWDLTGAIARRLPGLALSGAVALAALALEMVERRLAGRAWLESLVLAIVIGAAVRTAWTPGERWRAGVEFAAKPLLEVAVVLLGASVSAATLLSAGPALLAAIAGVVVVAIAASYCLGRLCGLPHRMATLVACGNSICGNSAIAATAPVIGADGEDVASAIAFTAVLGVAAVLGLPALGGVLHLSALSYGAFAGLTVYAVPQVLAATVPMGPVAVQFGTLVKLVRVLMLGPVCLGLSLFARRAGGASGARAASLPHPPALVPWFIVGFLALVAARSLGTVPAPALPVLAQAAGFLSVVAMAGLGLGTDIRTVARSGGRVALAATGSLVLLGALSLGVVHALRLG